MSTPLYIICAGSIGTAIACLVQVGLVFSGIDVGFVGSMFLGAGGALAAIQLWKFSS